MSVMQNSHIIAGVFGATMGLISAATVFLYNRIMERQQHLTVNRSIDNVNRKVLELQTELEELRRQHKSLQKNRKNKIRRQGYSNDNSYSGTDNIDMDTYSIAGTDIGDDEFFDCSDDENSAEENGTTEEQVEENLEFMELCKECDNDYFDINLYNKLKDALTQTPNNVEVVWRFARSCYHCSLNDQDNSKDYIHEGCDACEKILDVHNGNLFEWYAILIGVKSKNLPLKEKITSGFQFKKYVEKALEINSNNGFLYYLRGRFKYEISELNWFEKKLASAFISKLPNESYEEAILDFERAETLFKEPNYINKLYLGKSYIAIGKFQEGITWLSQVKDIEANDTEEIKILNEAETLLEKYSNYNT